MATAPDPRRAPAARIAFFVAVGCVAAAVHWSAVMWLVGRWHWSPLAANLPAWLTAFGVSFAGHHRLTFRDQGAHWGVAAARFFLVSASGFAVNETAYALALRWQPEHYGILLGFVLVGVATLTYLLSRHWAFLRSPAS